MRRKTLRNLLNLVPLFTGIGVFSTGFSAWVMVDNIITLQVPVEVLETHDLLTLNITEESNYQGYNTVTLGELGFQTSFHDIEDDRMFEREGTLEYYLKLDTKGALSAGGFIYDTNKVDITVLLTPFTTAATEMLQFSDFTITHFLDETIGIFTSTENGILYSTLTLPNIDINADSHAFKIAYRFTINDMESYKTFFNSHIKEKNVSFRLSANVLTVGV